MWCAREGSLYFIIFDLLELLPIVKIIGIMSVEAAGPHFSTFKRASCRTWVAELKGSG